MVSQVDVWMVRRNESFPREKLTVRERTVRYGDERGYGMEAGGASVSLGG